MSVDLLSFSLLSTSTVSHSLTNCIHGPLEDFRTVIILRLLLSVTQHYVL